MEQGSSRAERVRTTTPVIAMLMSASSLSRFGPELWPHHLALHEISQAGHASPILRAAAQTWAFTPSTGAGVVLPGLLEVFWHLAAEGWIERDAARGDYRITDELRCWGVQLLAGLAAADRDRLHSVARQWTNWSVMASKNAA